MSTADNAVKLSVADRLEAHREIMRRSLDELAGQVEVALRDAGLGFPIYLAAPNSGNSIVTFTTPLDPSDPD